MIAGTWFRRHKRILFVGSGCLVLLLILGGYVLWGNAVWATYHSSYAELKDTTKKSVDVALRLPSGSSKERAL